MLAQAKQISKFIQGFIGITNSAITAPAGSKVVTAEVTASLGGTLPLQLASSTQMGVVTNPFGNNKIEIWNNADGTKYVDGSNNEVYGRITEALGVYTLTFYTNVAGVQTAYTFTTNTNIDYVFVYQYDFNNLPNDFAVKYPLISVSNDPASSGNMVLETLTVTATNTLSALSFTPKNVNQVMLFINKLVYTTATAEFTVAGTTVTLVPLTLGFDVETTDEVVAYYEK